MYLITPKALMPLGFFLNNTIEVDFIMITSRILRQAIFRGVLGLILITGFHFDAIASTSNEDVEARKKLVEKYKDHKLIRARLETILIIGLGRAKDNNREEINKFFNAPYDIANEKTPEATEALVDLLDFYIGEHTSAVTIPELISARGREAIPFLKRKICHKPLSFEQNIRDRNKFIVELIKTISCNTKGDESHFTKEEILRSHLFDVQMRLEKYYCKNGYYPNKLLEVFSVDEYFEMGADNKFYYKSCGQIYFLCALGEDGKFGTADDVKPPYNTDVFSFPDNFKE
jgi:hypothetical protein